ncbi:hypothetical protein FRX31_031469 [Thalictrum thalictroides]|uniref:Uncharacterized protein n=1 Tax=Thalictrum thalictroides TaxID=46969 RepID=A0A7J6V256_THATH|nr:hypothetical protein FRX31_031469 [Thalictrum thalictroides]
MTKIMMAFPYTLVVLRKESRKNIRRKFGNYPFSRIEDFNLSTDLSLRVFPMRVFHSVAGVSLLLRVR